MSESALPQSHGVPGAATPAGAEPAREADLPRTRLDVAGLVPRYQTPLLRYVGGLLHGDRDQAQDLVQEVFLRLHRQVQRNGGHAGVDNISCWLFRVAHNLTMDHCRRQTLERAAADAEMGGQRSRGIGRVSPSGASGTSGGGGSGGLEQREVCDRAMAELYRLPDEQKSVLLLKIVQGMSLREISAVTGLTVGNAGYRINQGLRELARRLKESGVMD
jgi:RNA polymerase sigma-70 factor (ECF subfamily)